MRPLSPNARQVLEARYLRRNPEGTLLEGFEDLCTRVAGAVALAEPASCAERLEEEFRELLLRREFLPNSPTLMNAGCGSGQLSACFVLPVEDSMDGIFETVKRMAVIHQSGGGTGFSFSRVRARHDEVAGSPGVASGPVAFLGVFDAATAVVKQGGRRRGANMGILRVDHPDIRAFIAAKLQPDQLTNFNLSVGVTDAFMNAVRDGARFELVNPRDGKSVEALDARGLFEELSEHAWATGDPGVVFLDALERDNPTPALGPLAATNPCGELPLLPNESCNLGSIRLDAFVVDGRFDEPRLDRVVGLAVRFLDDVIEVGRAPFDDIERATRATRKIGLGVMGFADLLVDLGIPYDTPNAARLARRVMRRIRQAAERASVGLAAERGVFPAYAGSAAEARGLPLRNATLTAIAPTGSLSLLADCSSGIEPYFGLAIVRNVLDGERLAEVTPRFEAALRRAGVWSESLIDEVRAAGSARAVSGVPEEIARLFPTSRDIPAQGHLAVQEAFQGQVENAVSKTINLDRRATPEDIQTIYQSAWARGLKGVTVFREGSKGSAVIEAG